MHALQPINISNGTTEIHPYREKDILRQASLAAQLFEIYGDPEAMTFTPEKLVTSKETIEKWLFGVVINYHRQAQYTHFISAVGHDITVGQIDIIAPKSVEHYLTIKDHWFLEYALLKQLWGRGMMSGAISAVVQNMVGQGITKIAAACWPTNTGSIRVLERAGFVRKGKFDDYQDLYVYAG